MKNPNEEFVEMGHALQGMLKAIRRHPIQTAFWIVLFGLPVVAFVVDPQKRKWTSLTQLQLLYAVISMELAVVVYVYGVGNWSRFQPPKLRSVGWGAGAKNPPDAKQGGTPVTPAVAPPQTATPQPGTSPKPEGGQ